MDQLGPPRQPLISTVVHNARLERLSIEGEMRVRPVFHAEFGAYLKEVRESKARSEAGRATWTLRGVAERAHRRGFTALSRQILFRLEQGQTRHPDAEVLLEVAELYGLAYADLVDRYLASEYGLHSVQRDLSGHAIAANSTPTQEEAVAAKLAAATRHIEQLEERLAEYRAIADETQAIAARLLRLSSRDHEVAPARTAQSEGRRRARKTRG